MLKYTVGGAASDNEEGAIPLDPAGRFEHRGGGAEPLRGLGERGMKRFFLLSIMLSLAISIGGGPACAPEPEEVSLLELLTDYYENELAANRKYRGRKIKIAGAPDYIDMSRAWPPKPGKAEARPAVILSRSWTRDPLNSDYLRNLISVECIFDHKKIEPLAKALDAMTGRQDLTVSGTVTGIDLSYRIKMEKCAVQ